MSSASPRQRLRTVSRIALYGGLVLVAGVDGLLLHLASGPLREAPRQAWLGVDYASLEEVELLRQYVRIDTTAATGSTLDGARFLAGELQEAGIPYHLERVGEDEANLWAVIEGEEPGAVVLHHHIDVEDIHEPELWGHDPFGADLEAPWLYGRGTFDMKSIGIAQLQAFIRLAESGVTPGKSVIYLATTGEETGSELGTRWILREHPELVERFDLVLTEGGVVEGRSPEEVKYWGTEFAQKRFLTLVVCDPSRERLEQLREDVAYQQRDWKLRLADEVERFLPIYAQSRDREDFRQALANPERIVRDRVLFEEMPGYIQAMFRNELHAFFIRPAEGGGWELPVKIHLLPGTELDEVRDRLLPEWLFFGLETRIEDEGAAGHGSPIDHRVFEAVEESLREVRGRTPGGPLFLPWTATDARFFRSRGIPAYGFSPFTFLTSDVLRVSRPEERIDLPGYVDGVAIYEHLLHRLAR